VKCLIVEMLFLLLPIIVGAETHECGIVTRNGNEVTIVADEIRAVDALVNTLAQSFGVLVSTEEPEYRFAGDFESVRTALPDWSGPHPKADELVPKCRRIKIRFLISPTGAPGDVPALLRQIVQKANEQTPFDYRLDIDGEFATLVPTTTRDAKGDLVRTTPLLDRTISIPFGRRTIAENGQLLAESLSRQTGLKVSCCQSFVAGRLWGESVVEFGAQNEIARKVLERLIRLSFQSRPVRDYWLARCDGGYCFIDLRGVSGGACR
jgi:hypothetical protein